MGKKVIQYATEKGVRRLRHCLLAMRKKVFNSHSPSCGAKRMDTGLYALLHSHGS